MDLPEQSKMGNWQWKITETIQRMLLIVQRDRFSKMAEDRDEVHTWCNFQNMYSKTTKTDGS